MPGRRKKHFKGNLRNSVIERFTLGSAELDPSLAEEEDEDQAEGLDPAKMRKKEEEQKYGIYFDDEYNYLQHLKDVSDIQQSEMKQLVVLDPSGEASEVMRIYKGDPAEEGAEGEEAAQPGDGGPMAAGGLAMASALPEIDPDMDPEILAALGDEFNFDDPDNELEDDFMNLAEGALELEMAGGEERLAQNFHDVLKIEQQNSSDDVVIEEEEEEEDDEEEEEDDSDVGSDVMECSDDEGDWTDDEEEGDDEKKMKKHVQFSSLVLPRNNKLQLLDAQTKAVMQREYTEDQIGPLDFEELNGRVTFDSDLFHQTVKEMYNANSIVTLKDIVDSKDRVRPVIPESWKYIEERQEGDTDEEEERERRHFDQRFSNPPKKEFDCVSILSTLSTTKNIPKTVSWPSPNAGLNKGRQRAPSEMDMSECDSTRGLTLKELEQQMKTERLADAPPTYRPTNETVEEKKERKNAVKEHKRERRVEKKANKMAFRSEMQKQKKLLRSQAAQENVTSLQYPN